MRSFLTLRRGLLIGGVVAVFIAGFVLDPQAVARVFWACLAGQAGPWARWGAIALLLAISAAISCVFYRPARPAPPPVKVRKKAAPRAVRTEVAEAAPAAEGAPAPKRRPRKAVAPMPDGPVPE